MIKFSHKRNIDLQKVASKMLGQVADRHSPWLADRCSATRQRNIFEMSGAFETFISGQEHFPAPDFSISAITSSIKGKSDHPTGKVVLRHTTRNVRVVVLHADDADARHSILFDGPFRGEILRDADRRR